MMNGDVLLNGRPTLVLCGKSIGHILNLVRSWLRVHLTELLLFGKRLVIILRKPWFDSYYYFSISVGETGGTTQSKNQSHWVKRTSLVDSRTNVTDIKFAPKHMGLILAMCSADGGVK